MSNRCSSGSAPVKARKSLLRSPLFGAASNSQATAPRKGGVTKDAVTSARTVRRSGMSVRATSHPMGAATAQQITAELNAKMAVMNAVIDEPGQRQQDQEAQRRRKSKQDRQRHVERSHPTLPRMRGRVGWGRRCGNREGQNQT